MHANNRWTALDRLQRRTSLVRQPGLSIRVLLILRIRILAEFLIKSIPLFGRQRKLLRTLRERRSGWSGSDALVIANGPSSFNLPWHNVAQAQAEGLRVVTVNYYPLAPSASIVKPDVLVLSDPAMKPSILNERNEAMWQWIYENPQVDVALPTSWHRSVEECRLDRRRILFFNDLGLEGWTTEISPMRPRGYLSMTAYKALAITAFLAPKRIFIIGFDNSMFREVRVDVTNRVHQGPHHFFEHGGIDTDLTARYQNGISDYFNDVSLCFHNLRTMFGGLPIFNLDPESLVDCFTKLEAFDWKKIDP